jgi:hypothetical protein
MELEDVMADEELFLHITQISTDTGVPLSALSEQFRAYTTARDAVAAGTGDLDTMENLVTPTVAAMLDLIEQCVARIPEPQPVYQVSAWDWVLPVLARIVVAATVMFVAPYVVVMLVFLVRMALPLP